MNFLSETYETNMPFLIYEREAWAVTKTGNASWKPWKSGFLEECQGRR